jgi:hypothetical protein
MGTDDEDEKSKDINGGEEKLSPQEKQMSDNLNLKRTEIIHALIDNLSSKNKTDFEACLNAHLILTELTETEITFSKLI